MDQPKSKFSKNYSSGGEFIYGDTKLPFKGFYILQSDGMMFEGKSLKEASKLGKQIIPKKEITPLNSYKLNKTDIINLYYNTKINKGVQTSKKHDNFKPIFNSKPLPTVEDYEKGFFYRLFAKRRNVDNFFLEINEETYDDLVKQEGKFDHNMYSVGRIKWRLVDEAGTNSKTNRKTIRRISKKGKMPGLKRLFLVFDEYNISGDKLIHNQTQLEEINSRPTISKQQNQLTPLEEVQQTYLNNIKQKHIDQSVNPGMHHSQKTQDNSIKNTKFKHKGFK